MKKVPVLMVAVYGLLLCIPSLSHAIPIKVDFSAYGFVDQTPGSSIAPPNDPVSGFIVYNSSVTGNIASLESVSLTIHGHTYGIGEIGYYPIAYTGEAMIIGGQENSVNGLSPGYDDFMLHWSKTAMNFPDFTYSSSKSGGTWWKSYTFSKFTIEPVSAPVPEPGTMMLLGSGLAGLVGYGRRRMKK
jgi:hypothetical protein